LPALLEPGTHDEKRDMSSARSGARPPTRKVGVNSARSSASGLSRVRRLRRRKRS